MRIAAMTVLMSGIALAAGPATEIRMGDPLPELRGQYLTGRDAILPAAASGKVALLLVGFTYQSRFAVEPWAEKFRAQWASHESVTFYEVPVIGGMARLGKWFIDSGMRRGTPKDDYGHVITVYGGADAWKKRLGFAAPDAAYLVLLDRAGRVAWRYQGPFDETASRALDAKVLELTATP
jgi:hypothetical protein